MVLMTDKCTFYIAEKVKQTRVGSQVKPLEFLKYPSQSKLCVVTHIHEYKRTEPLRKNVKQLFISYVKPYGPVSKDSIAQWIKSVLSFVGLDVNRFEGHSVRAASTSYLALHGCNIKDMEAAGSSNEQTFEKYYNKLGEDRFNSNLKSCTNSSNSKS